MSLRRLALGYWAMRDRVLVTGARGFVGQYLVAALEAEGHDVTRHSLQDGDISRCDLLYDGVTYVFHLAARTFIPDSWKNARSFYDTNVLGTVNVLEFCRKHKCPLAIMSSYVYGRPKYLPIDENHPLEGFNPYAHTKILAEEAAHFYAEQFRLQVAVARPFNLYGIGQSDHFLIPTLVKQAVALGDAITVADTRPKRDFLHVRDLVALLLLIAKHRAAGVYNAGSGVSTSIGELVELINDSVPRPKKLISTGQIRENEVLETIADCSRVAAEFGWTPRTRMSDGIRELVQDALSAQARLGRL
jgi:nucleoside-diphosphate-sugar epimerase